MPVLSLGLTLRDGQIRYPDLPTPLHDVNCDMDIVADMHNEAVSLVRINSLKAKTQHSSLRVSGTIDRLHTDPRIDLVTDVEADLAELNPMLPAELNAKLKGGLKGRIRSNVSMSHIEKMAVEKMRISGRLTLSNLEAQYDTVSVRSSRSVVELALPNPKPSTPAARFLFAKLISDDLAASTGNISASLAGATIAVESSDVRDAARTPSLTASFNIAKLNAAIDTISVAIADPAGMVAVAPQRSKPDQLRLTVKYNCSSLAANMGGDKVQARNAFVNSDVLYDGNQTELVRQIIPRGSFGLEEGRVEMAAIEYPVEIQAMKVAFDPKEFSIDRAQVAIGRSDFSLSGRLTNLYRYIKGDSLLRGNFNFVSENTDITQLMRLTSGIGDSGAATAQAGEQPSEGPFMVPKGVDVTLHANVGKGVYGPSVISDIGGDLRIRDGVLALDNLTLSAPGGDMRVTALYRTPVRNHLYAGLDFHLTNVEIDRMIAIIPDLEELMPMLRSFSGKAALHLAIETYLDSLYNVKMSTLRGSAAIDGKDLVLMDGETFTEIAKMLMFKKSTVNKVDSIAAVFTIFRDEIDVYPFLVGMDRYKAVVSGRHNADMTFNYNVSLVETPLHLPFNLAVDVSGNIDKLKYRPARSKYPEFYRPAARREVENKQLEIKQMIHKALTEGVVKKE
jgi:hypothetical protein